MSHVHLLSAGHIALLYVSPYAPTHRGSQLILPAGTGFRTGPESASRFHQSLPLSFHHRSIPPLHVLHLHAIYSFPLTLLTQLYPKTSRLEQELRRDLIAKREFCPAIPLFLILFLAVGSEALLLAPFYIIASLLFDPENFLGYLHITAKTTFVTTRVIPSLHRVSCFEAPIHVPRPRNPSLRPLPPYVRGPRVILEDETDESLSS